MIVTFTLLSAGYSHVKNCDYISSIANKLENWEIHSKLYIIYDDDIDKLRDQSYIKDDNPIIN